MKNRLWLALFAACTVVSAIAFNVVTTKRQLAAEVHSQSRPQSETLPSVPEHIIYGFLFRNVTRNNERNIDLRAKGTVTKKYFAFRRELGFTAEQSRLLTEIASDCESQVRQQDRNAQFIIAEFRARLPKTKEAQAPPPPAELKTMWEERNAIILRARDRLRDALGEDTFDRLDNFAKFRYGTNKTPVSLRPIDREVKQDH